MMGVGVDLITEKIGLEGRRRLIAWVFASAECLVREQVGPILYPAAERVTKMVWVDDDLV